MKSIRHTETLYYYDGPQVFEAGDGSGGHYIAVMVEPDAGQDQYLVAGVESDRLRQFRKGTLDLRSLLAERGDKGWFLAKANGGLDTPLVLEPQSTPLAASSYLPEPGFLLQNSPANEDAVLGHAGLDCGCASGASNSLATSIQKLLNVVTLTIYAEDGDYPALESAFKKAGVKCKRSTLVTLSAGGGNHKVLWVGLAQNIHAVIEVILDFARHRKRRLVLKSGGREFQAENYSAEQLAEILPKAQEAFFRDGGSNDAGQNYG